MRYQLKCYDRLPQQMIIEVSKEIRDITEMGSPADIVNTAEGQVYGHRKILRDLCMIDGVTEVRAERYEVKVTKASDLFDWADVLRGILYVLQEHLDPNGEMKEASPKKVIVMEWPKEFERRPLKDLPFDDDNFPD